MATDPSRPRFERTRRGVASVRARAEELTQQAQEARRRHRSVDAVFDMADRDAEVGGGLIAGALAYRFFIWLLPFVLVAVAGLGIAADASSTSPEDAADEVGLADLVTRSVAQAANSSARWYALVVGLFALVLATRSVLRALIGAHRLVWTDVRGVAPRPTLLATFRLLALFLAFFALAGLTGAVRGLFDGLGLLAIAFLTLPYAGLWLLVTIRLPHRGADWTALVPGALLVGVGLQVLHVVAALFIGPVGDRQAGDLRRARRRRRAAPRVLPAQPADRRGGRAQCDALGTAHPPRLRGLRPDPFLHFARWIGIRPGGSSSCFPYGHWSSSPVPLPLMSAFAAIGSTFLVVFVGIFLALVFEFPVRFVMAKTGSRAGSPRR